MVIATIAFLSLYFGGGGGFAGIFPEDFNDRVEAVILEEDRREQVLDITEQMEKLALKYNIHLENVSEEVMELHKNYGTPREELERNLIQILNERRDVQNLIIDDFFKMKELITQNEWEAIFTVDEN